MSTLRHSYGDSVILASLKTSVPETKISVIWRSHRYKKNCVYFWSSSVKTRGNICAISPFSFSAGRTAVYGWRQRVTIPVSHAFIPDLVFKPWLRQLESWTFLRRMFHQRRFRFRRSRIVIWQWRDALAWRDLMPYSNAASKQPFSKGTRHCS